MRLAASTVTSNALNIANSAQLNAPNLVDYTFFPLGEFKPVGIMLSFYIVAFKESL